MQVEDYEASFHREREAREEITRVFNKKKKAMEVRIRSLSESNSEMMAKLNQHASRECQNEFGVSGHTRTCTYVGKGHVIMIVTFFVVEGEAQT